MYLLLGIMGALFGARTAKKRNGTRADVAQYAAVYGIFFALIGLIFTIILKLLKTLTLIQLYITNPILKILTIIRQVS